MTYNNAYKSVDYQKIYIRSNEYLVCSKSIGDFPFKTKAFIEEHSDIRLCSFKKAQDKYNIHIPLFGSESAVIQEMSGAYIIFYNQNEPDYRVRFSIIHEFAHFILGHKMNLNQSDPLYDIQELEANCFAAQLLMPEQILRECSKRHKAITVDFIINSFDVSEDAAKKRKKTMANTVYEWNSRAIKEYDDLIILKYANKLNTIAPKPQEFDYYDFEDDYSRQIERDSWLDNRSRWN